MGLPSMKKLRAAAQAAVEEWKHPEGTLVTVTRDRGEKLATHTRSMPWVVGETAVILVSGISGGYMLERVKPRDGLRAVLAKPGEPPSVVHLLEGDGAEAQSQRRDQVGHLLDAGLVEWVRWGQGLLVAVDEDARSKHLALNMALHRQSQQGAELQPFEVHGPALVIHHDDVGRTPGFTEENARTMVDLLRALQVGR